MQGEIERAGIPTVSISLLKDITLKVKPPRALWVPFNHGYPLGEPDNPAIQKEVLQAALSLLTEAQTAPVILRDFVSQPGAQPTQR